MESFINKIYEINKDINLQKHINDPDFRVREAIAKRKYRLNILINDPHWKVRSTVAEQNYGLEILINDPHWCVRQAVAYRGYGLDILINDSEWKVRSEVLRYCKNHKNNPICKEILMLNVI